MGINNSFYLIRFLQEGNETISKVLSIVLEIESLMETIAIFVLEVKVTKMIILEFLTKNESESTFPNESQKLSPCHFFS